MTAGAAGVWIVGAFTAFTAFVGVTLAVNLGYTRSDSGCS
jgi:hypothetical protein